MNRSRRLGMWVALAVAGGMIVGCGDRKAVAESSSPAFSPEIVRALAERSADPGLQAFYAKSEPIWATAEGLTDRGKQAVTILRASADKGLDAKDYVIPETGGPPAETELAITRGLLRYTRDLRWGRRNPGIYGQKPGPAADLLLAVTADPDGLDASFTKLEPRFAEYQAIEAALPRYRDNGTPQQLQEIALTLEHWRWLPREFAHGPVIVNVPEFMVRVFDDQLKPVIAMRAIVGQPTHPTPLFNGQISFLIFGPYWNVPPSILHKEILPDIRKDRAYLKKNQYEVQDQRGTVVSTGEVTDEILAGLRADRYKIRQVPGPKNALGHVKFMFPNEESVYLHDTNNRSLFQKDVRAFSHGCIRIEKPKELAEWVLRSDPTWTKNRIAEALQQAQDQKVNLKQPLPIFITYRTVVADDRGELTFLKDLYGRNAQELPAANAANVDVNEVGCSVVADAAPLQR